MHRAHGASAYLLVNSHEQPRRRSALDSELDGIVDPISQDDLGIERSESDLGEPRTREQFVDACAVGQGNRARTRGVERHGGNGEGRARHLEQDGRHGWH